MTNIITEIEKPNVPFVTVEYSPVKKLMLQCYGNKNSKPPENVMKFIESRLLKAANNIVSA